MAKDPVCGMTVNEGGPRSQFVKTCYFCCDGCKQSFDREPERYAAARQ